MGNTWFRFKQFYLVQEHSGLKVGTDSVLLGAWCHPGEAARILDVGTGTGLLALMMAQQSTALIDAVEISPEACLDAVRNFSESAWQDRLTLHQTDFNSFCLATANRYDLVICNPPYFQNSIRSANHATALARHDGNLSFSQLISGAARLLNPSGRMAVVLPNAGSTAFRETARLAGFYLSRKTEVFPRTGKPAGRVLLEFSLVSCYPENSGLTILDESGQYTADYRELTRNFYLDF